MCSPPNDLWGSELNNPLLPPSSTLKIKALMWWDGTLQFWSHWRFAVKNERTTTWLWCATFMKPRRAPAALCQRGAHGGGECAGASWGRVWSIDGKSREDKNQYLQGGWIFPWLLKRIVWRSLDAFSFPVVLHSGCSLSLARIPYSVWSSLPYRLKKRNRWGVSHIWLGIHCVVVRLHRTLRCDLFHWTSLVPLCMWVWLCESR